MIKNTTIAWFVTCVATNLASSSYAQVVDPSGSAGANTLAAEAAAILGLEAEDNPCPVTAEEVLARSGGAVVCHCPIERIMDSGEIWGIDFYRAESHVCRSALHAGVVTLQGGFVAFAQPIDPSQQTGRYQGSQRNAVTSKETNTGDGPRRNMIFIK